MTVNDLIGKIELRIKELGKLKTDQLRLEHPASCDVDVPTVGSSRRILKGMSREELIAEIIVEEFSLDFNRDIES